MSTRKPVRFCIDCGRPLQEVHCPYHGRTHILQTVITGMSLVALLIAGFSAFSASLMDGAIFTIWALLLATVAMFWLGL